jgi:GDP-L-fucose synthase
MSVSHSSLRLAVLGAGGLLGAEVCRRAEARGWTVFAARSAEVDARSEVAVFEWLAKTRPTTIVLCAARNAGIHANIAAPADMLAENTRIALASIGAARRAGAPRLLYCSSTAIYSEDAPLPLQETSVGLGAPELSHMGYSTAKLTGARYCQAVRIQDGLDYSALLLTNIYGPGQSYAPSRSNVAASLLARFHHAKISGADEVIVWGTGNATRDLIFSRDAAEAILMLARDSGPRDGLINIASGHEITIRRLAETVASVTGFEGRLVFDASQPEGASRRWIDTSRLNAIGWRTETSLEDGLALAYRAFLGQSF